MIDLFTFLLYALATYRLSLMVSRESGPGWMFKHILALAMSGVAIILHRAFTVNFKK